MALNVNRKVEDPFYRYKMPKLEAKIEGNGNGIKTVIPNMVEIARSLDRPPAYPTKFFGCELGAQVQMDAKAERYIVNGAHSANDLQNILDGFIQKFVLCPGCNNPETHLKVNKKKIGQVCVACGYRGTIDNGHRLVAYIINHPPNGDKDAKGKKDKKGKGKKGKKGSESDGPDSTTSPTNGAAQPVSSSRDNVRQRTEGIVDAPTVDDSEIVDEDWSEDTSAAAVRAREQAELSGAVTKLVAAEDQELPVNKRLELFHKFVEEKASQKPFPARDVLNKAELLDCKDKGIMVLAELLLNKPGVVEALKTYQGLLQRFTDENRKAQKYLLHAIEVIIKDHDLVSKVPNIFNALYDLDIVEEENFLVWNEKVSKKYVDKETSQKIHDAATPFIKWLEEASSDEDEDEDEDEDVQFDSNTDGVKTETVVVDAGDGSNDAEEEEDDDLDIDDI